MRSTVPSHDIAAMEELCANVRNEGGTMYTSNVTRRRPPIRLGMFEDLGSSIKPSSSSTAPKKPQTTGKPSRRKNNKHSESDDEMDCLAQHTEADEKVETWAEDGVLINGKLHAYHPDARPEKANVLKSLKFKKKNNPTGSQENASSQPSTSIAKSQTVTGTQRDSSSRIRTSPSSKSVASPNKVVRSRTSKVRAKPQMKPRPHPLLGTPPKKTEKPLSSLAPPPPLSSQNIDDKRPTAAKPTLDSSIESPVSITSASSSSSADSKISISSQSLPPASKSSAFKPSATTSRIPQDFPAISPLNSLNQVTPVRGSKSFPSLSPLDQHKVLEKAKDKGKRKAPIRDLQPFPMSTHPSSSAGEHYADVSQGSSEGENSQGGSAKRIRRNKGDGMHLLLDNMDLYEEEDSLFISPTVDPKTLCPYCDSPLPNSPTPVLKNLLESTAKKSYPDPRPTNPLGRKAPLATFIAVCQQHRFECQILPEAEARGWPKTIDWERLAPRIEKMTMDLQAIIDDSGDDIAEDGDHLHGSGGPRSRCVFWREVMKAVKARGSRNVAGVRGQFLDFEKAQPGYYGELGSIIIQQTLLNMFPPETFDLSKISPFTVNEFIHKILVPEVALRLIMEDQKLVGPHGQETALRILRDSTSYGVAMFPEDGESQKKNGKVEVGDRIVMERARKRRKELEGRGDIDNDFLNKEMCLDSEQEDRHNTGKSATSRRKMKGTKTSKPDAPKSRRVQSSQSSRKRTNNGDSDTNSVLSIGSSTEDNETEPNNQRLKSSAFSRPRRSTKPVNYTDVSTDDERPQRGSRSRMRSNPKTFSRSPSASEFPFPLTQPKRGPKPQVSSDMDLCSGSDDMGHSKRGPSKYGPSGNKISESPEDNSNISTKISTPTSKLSHFVVSDGELDPTPRPVTKTLPLKTQESVLARARNRKHPTFGSSQDGRSTTDGIAQWSFNMRAKTPEVSSSDKESSVARKPKRGSSYAWLLSDESFDNSPHKKSPRKSWSRM